MPVAELRIGESYGLDSSQRTLRGDRFGSLVTTGGGGTYQELTLRGHTFHAANAAAQAVSAALTTTYTGLLIANPPKSGYNISILQAGTGITTAAAAAIGLLAGWSSTPVTGTAGVYHPGLITSANAGTAVAQVWTASTLPGTPWVATAMGQSAATMAGQGIYWIDLNGSLVLGPGAFCGIYGSGAFTGVASISWAEMPI